MGKVAAIFYAFEGKWTLERHITQFGRMRGTASFTKLDLQTFLYEEKGELIRDSGERFDAFRKYIYRLTTDDKISVHFHEEKERLLHVLDFSANSATGTHVCACDIYQARYDFFTQNNFTMSYEVKGPRKDYSIHTMFHKIIPEESL